MEFTGFNEMQTTFIRWAVTKKSMLLRAPTGQGKTLAAFGLYAYLRKVLNFKHMVVVSKIKSLGAFEKPDNNRQHLITSKIYNKTDLAIFHENSYFSSELYLISAGQLDNLVRQGSYNQKKSFMRFLSEPTLFVVDELSDYRNTRSSNVAKSLDKIISYFHKLIDQDPVHFRFLGITATPVYKDLTNWFPIGNFLRPGMWGTYWNFMDRYVITESRTAYSAKKVYNANGSTHVKGARQFQQIVGFKNQAELYSRIEPYVFNWDKTQFTFIHHLVEYKLTDVELEQYNKNLKGEGLDKQYAIRIFDTTQGKERYIYRNKTDDVVLATGQRYLVRDLKNHTRILFDGAKCEVTGIFDRVCDGTAILRFLRAQSALVVQDKFKKIGDICEKHKGTFIYSNYLYNQHALYLYLLKRFPQRRIVEVNGATQNFKQLIRSLPPEAIVCASRVCAQSVDLYQDSIVFEVSPSNPGALNQILGRCARYNSDNKVVNCYFLYKDRGIDNYLLERCRLLLRDDKDTVYAKNIPQTPFVSKLGDNYTMDTLKQQLLWVV